MGSGAWGGGEFLETSLVVTSQGMLLASKAKDAAKRPIMHRAASGSPPAKNYAAQYVSGAEVEKSCSVGVTEFILYFTIYP